MTDSVQKSLQLGLSGFLPGIALDVYNINGIYQEQLWMFIKLMESTRNSFESLTT